MAAGRGGGCDAVQWRPGRLETLQLLLLTFSPASTRQQTAVSRTEYTCSCGRPVEGGRAAARPVDWAPQNTTAESSPVPPVHTLGPHTSSQHGGGRGGGVQALYSSGVVQSGNSLAVFLSPRSPSDHNIPLPEL